jgi:stalled ribosome rescue protein Dom34
MLIGLEGDRASTWDIYSESVKSGAQIQGEDEYNFYESIVDALRPSIKEGVKSILIAAPNEKDYRAFMDHIRKHQGWLLGGWSLNTATFTHIREPAMSARQVRELVGTRGFREKLTEASQGDIQQVMGVLEKRLNDPEGIETVLFTLKEVEEAVYGNGETPEYILVTELFLSRNRRRTTRLLQVAANRDVRTRIIGPDTPAGARIAQFGGLVCML